MKNRTLLLLLLVLLTGFDLTYSFFQHAGKPLDGDLPGGILPAADVRPVLNDPLGIAAIREGNTYPNPNRFFCHYSFYIYFNTTPFVLQKLMDPITSIYYASAIFKTIVQLCLIFLMASILSGRKRNTIQFLLITVLIFPFFQTNGFQSEIGIIDSSITYTFFYAYPLIFLLLYFKPLFGYFIHEEKIPDSITAHIYRIALAFPVCLSGPLNPGIVLIVVLLLLINYFYDFMAIRLNKATVANKEFKFPRHIFFYFLPAALMAVYSLYLGTYNSITIANEKPLSELYRLLLQGIYHELVRNAGLFFLCLSVFLQMLILYVNKVFQQNEKIKAAYFWSFLFCILYIFLLPLGGYREYRPEILRYDTLIPVTMVLIFLFVYSFFAISEKNSSYRKPYLAFIGGVLLLFILKDAPEFHKNESEKRALYQIARSDEKIVYLNHRLQVISWAPLTEARRSVMVGEMLYKFKVTQSPKLFYYKEK